MKDSLLFLLLGLGLLALGVWIGLEFQAWQVRHFRKERDADRELLRRYRSGEALQQAYAQGRERGAADALRKLHPPVKAGLN